LRGEAARVLVVRRDNIGDLVCTTPLFAALRRKFPDAWIGALVNSYNAAVLERNPDLDEVVVYSKLKHLDPGESAVAALWQRLRDFWRLRRRGLDYLVLATPEFVPRSLGLARVLAPRCLVGFSDGSATARRLDLSLPVTQVGTMHEVERVFALGAHFGLHEPIPALRVVPHPGALRMANEAFARHAGLRVGVQISTRRPNQRWPTERFVELIGRLHRLGAGCMLLWSPGAADHPRHPGDDEKAMEIARKVGDSARLIAYRAGPLAELIGALAACDLVVTPDGGAMHLAAALGKPIVCFFGDMPPERWRPWGVPHRLLRPDSRTVAELSVDEVVGAFAELAPPR
jgi:ADP-heptose:LPS heptosyltransferase